MSVGCDEQWAVFYKIQLLLHKKLLMLQIWVGWGSEELRSKRWTICLLCLQLLLCNKAESALENYDEYNEDDDDNDNDNDDDDNR